jgi:hypothetical protein
LDQRNEGLSLLPHPNKNSLAESIWIDEYCGRPSPGHIYFGNRFCRLNRFFPEESLRRANLILYHDNKVESYGGLAFLVPGTVS